jgi:hypothetical protein
MLSHYTCKCELMSHAIHEPSTQHAIIVKSVPFWNFRTVILCRCPLTLGIGCQIVYMILCLLWYCENSVGSCRTLGLLYGGGSIWCQFWTTGPLNMENIISRSYKASLFPGLWIPRATSHTRLRARDHYTSGTLIGGKGGAGPSLLHTMLEEPQEYVNARRM